VPIHAANVPAVTSVAAADPVHNRQLTRQLTLGGLLTALILILLTAKLYLPTADLVMLSLTSLCVAVAVMEMGLRPAFMVYMAAALLSLAWPGLAAAFPYIVVFGPYPLVRAVIDRRFGRLAAILLKLVTGNILVILAVLLFTWADLTMLAGRYSFFWLIAPVLLQAILLVFDYALGLMIQFYAVRLRRK
jgi:hypothetical protein